MTQNEQLSIAHLTEWEAEGHLAPNKLFADILSRENEQQLRAWLERYTLYSFVLMPKKQFEQRIGYSVPRDDIGELTDLPYQVIPKELQDELYKSNRGVPVAKSYIQQLLNEAIELRRD